MCVRYTLHKSDAAIAVIARSLGRKLAPPGWAAPKYNLTLTNTVPVVAIESDLGPAVYGMRWGMTTAFGDGPPRLWPNAMAEKAFKSPAWRSATAKRRCLVPANGFYEWETAGGVKYPHLFTLRDEEPFAFAGIWSKSSDPDEPESFAILTTEPNSVVGRYHDRMPVLLPAELMPRWIGTEPLSPEEFQSLTRPLDPARMDEREVSRYVSKSGHDGPRCHAGPEPRQTPEAPSPQLDLGL